MKSFDYRDIVCINFVQNKDKLMDQNFVLLQENASIHNLMSTLCCSFSRKVKKCGLAKSTLAKSLNSIENLGGILCVKFNQQEAVCLDCSIECHHFGNMERNTNFYFQIPQQILLKVSSECPT